MPPPAISALLDFRHRVAFPNVRRIGQARSAT
jgi:hypothetical protein